MTWICLEYSTYAQTLKHLLFSLEIPLSRQSGARWYLQVVLIARFLVQQGRNYKTPNCRLVEKDYGNL